jgi:hypothetical protein
LPAIRRNSYHCWCEFFVYKKNEKSQIRTIRTARTNRPGWMPEGGGQPMRLQNLYHCPPSAGIRTRAGTICLLIKQMKKRILHHSYQSYEAFRVGGRRRVSRGVCRNRITARHPPEFVPRLVRVLFAYKTHEKANSHHSFERFRVGGRGWFCFYQGSRSKSNANLKNTCFVCLPPIAYKFSHWKSFGKAHVFKYNVIFHERGKIVI